MFNDMNIPCSASLPADTVLPGPRGAERGASAFTIIQLQHPATSVLRQPPYDKSTSNYFVHRVSFISVGGLQSIRR